MRPMDRALYILVGLLGIAALLTLSAALFGDISDHATGTIATVFGTIGTVLTALIGGSYFSKEVREETEKQLEGDRKERREEEKSG